MAYATHIQFVGLVGEAEARALAPPASLATPGYDVAKVGQALDRATATLNSYLATKYSTPLDPVPELVMHNALILAREDLDRQGRDFVTKAADRVRAWAKDLSRGTATLGIDAASPTAPATTGDGGGVLIDAPARVFDNDGLAAFLGSGA